jgi:predicted chitinase
LAVIAANVHSSLATITAAQLTAIMPQNRHPEYLVHINAALTEGSINTCHRKAAFLAQLAHESGQLVYMEEIASGDAYEGRLDLGNTQPGDGRRFKGRGPIQLTGRANYRAAGQALGLNLEANPQMVATPQVGFRTSVWFWTRHNLNALADAGTLDAFRQITRKINGGTNGQADREKYWASAKNVLSCGSGTGVVSCTSGGQTGQCIPTASCGGASVAGLCPGAADIKCCIGAAAGPSCTVNGRSGVCRDKATCTGTTYSGYCPGAANIQCCI